MRPWPKWRSSAISSTPRILQYIGQQIAGFDRQLEKKPDDPKLQAAKLRMENGRKAYGGYLDGLKNAGVMAIKQKAEKAIRAKLEADPDLSKRFGKAFAKIESIMEGVRNGEAPGSHGDRSRTEEDRRSLLRGLRHRDSPGRPRSRCASAMA